MAGGFYDPSGMGEADPSGVGVAPSGGGGFDWGSMAGALGKGLSQFGGQIGDQIGASNWKNPADSAMGYLNQIPGTMKPYYQNFIDAGNTALPGLQSQFGSLVNDPAGKLNSIGAGYHQSPGFAFALQQALQGANHAAAAGGMAGSPMSQQQNMALATNLANQDYNQWLGNAMNLFGSGLGGMQDIMHQGYNASNELGQSLGNNLLAQSQLAYAGTQGANAQSGSRGSGIGSMLGGIGNLFGGMGGGGGSGGGGGGGGGDDGSSWMSTAMELAPLVMAFL